MQGLPGTMDGELRDLKDVGVKQPGTSLNQNKNWFGGEGIDEDLCLSSLTEERRTLAPTFLVKLIILNIVTVSRSPLRSWKQLQSPRPGSGESGAESSERGLGCFCTQQVNSDNGPFQ